MLRMKLILIQLFILCGYSFAVPNESQKPAAAYSPSVEQTVNPQKEDIEVSESTVPYRLGGVKISTTLRKKILEMESIAVQDKGQDSPTFDRLGNKIWLKIVPIRFNDEFVEILADKKVDWRVRFVLINVKRRLVSDRKIEKYLPAFKKMLLDNSEHPKVRGIVATMIGELAPTNEEVKVLLTSVAADSATPPEVVQPAMSMLGLAGIDDIDRLVEIMDRRPKDANDIGVSLNAVRALCRSKNPKAPDLLMKIFDESVPDSFFNVTAIEQFQCMMRTSPERRAKLEPVLVPKLIKLLDDRSYIGASRQDAARLLIYLKAKGVYEPITRWFLPVRGTTAETGGGGSEIDVTFGAQFLADMCDKRGIPVLEEVLKKYPIDPRFSWAKESCEKEGIKYPEGASDYKKIKERLERLRKCKPE